MNFGTTVLWSLLLGSIAASLLAIAIRAGYIATRLGEISESLKGIEKFGNRFLGDAIKGALLMDMLKEPKLGGLHVLKKRRRY